ncbi:MAG TPA: hypothetical protein VGP07_10855 [Polyangia bacterium]
MKPRSWSYRAPRIGALAVIVWGLSACGSGAGGSGAGGSGGSGASTGGSGGAATGGSGGSGGSTSGGTGGTSSTGHGGDVGSGGASGGTGGPGATAAGGAGGGSGTAGAGAAGSSGAAGSGGAGGQHTGGAGGGGHGGAAGGTSVTSVTFDADRVIVTGVRGTASPAAASTITLHNGGAAAVQVSGISVTQTGQLALGPSGMAAQATATPLVGASPFTIASPASFPASLGAGMDLGVTVQMSTTASNLPAPPSDKNLGSTFLTATLTATVGSTPVTATVYGLVLTPHTPDNYEPTLGQILVALGYKLNVGKAQNNWNPNTSMMAVDLPGVEAGTDEVAAPLFVKAGSGPVTLAIAARFSPVGELPYGWYPSTGVATMNQVGTLSMITDAQTSNKARMVYPPLKAGSATTFDPGSASFGLYIYSDQKTEMYKEGGNTINGDYDYTQDALNSPAGVHRVKSYPLKDGSGTAIPHQFLVAIEEAGNGDYQDYVFVLGNVSVAP